MQTKPESLLKRFLQNKDHILLGKLGKERDVMVHLIPTSLNVSLLPSSSSAEGCMRQVAVFWGVFSNRLLSPVTLTTPERVGWIPKAHYFVPNAGNRN